MDLFPPTEQQQRIIEHRGSNLLIFAGPGTGKTETLARRFASLVADDGIKPSQILVLTFSRRAAEEMRERILLRLRQRCGRGLAVSELFVKTFHSFCRRVLDGDNARLADRRLLTPVKERLMWRRAVSANGIALRSLRPDVLQSERFATDALNVITQLKGQGVTFASLSRAAGKDQRLQDVASVFEAMERQRKRLDLRDFRDLVIDAVNALEADGDEAKWLRAAAFCHVLVDEFQDSDPIQLRLLQGVARIITPTPIFCFVGDVNQSIYRFRGAAPDNVEEAQKAFHCDVLPLRDNRRSAQAILDVANADEALDKKSLTRAADQEKAGAVTFLRPRTVDDEVRFICKKIADRITGGVAARDIAVLLRETRPYRELLTTALRDAGVPVAASPAAGFHEDVLVDAVLTAMRLLANNANFGLWQRLLVNPILGYHAVGVRSAFDAARRESSGDAKAALLRNPPFGLRPIASFLDAWERCEDAYRTADPVVLIHRLVTELDLLRPIREPDSARFFDALASPARLDALLTAAADYREMFAGGGIADFIERLDETVGLLADANEPPPTVADGVRVMSIHAAKGLEFELVIVPQLIEGILPAGERPNRLLGPRSIDSLKRAGIEVFADLEDARREEHSLWYVALTRAKSEVLATAAQYDDEGVQLQPSSFAASIPNEVIATPQQTVIAKAQPPRQIQLALEPVAQAPAGIRLDLDSLSPSSINNFIICPRRFFYGDVLKLQRYEDDATRHGQLLHGILRRFHESERDFKNVYDVERTARDYTHRLDELIEDELARVASQTPTESAFTEYERQNLQTRLRMYAHKLTQEAFATPFSVLACEKSVTSFSDGIELHGKVDRIDRLASGGLVITDYKAGRCKATLAKALRKAFDQLDDGEDFFGDAPDGLNVQTLLYIAGVERAFGEPVVRVDYWYFRGKGADNNALLVDQTPIVSGEAHDERSLSRADVLRVEKDVAWHIARFCNEGSAEIFPTAKDERVCKYCDFIAICPGVGMTVS